MSFGPSRLARVPDPAPQPGAAVGSGAVRSGRPALRRVLVYGGLATVFLVCWLVLVVVNQLDVGLQLASLAAVLAALPLLVVIPAFLWLDGLEAEPARYLAFAFLWGALCAPVGALVLNTTAEMLLTRSGASDADLWSAVLSAPPVEEGLKGVAVLAILLFRRREFDGVIDGVVYAGLAGAGFAFSENVMYLGHAWASGPETLTFVFFARCVMAPFAHPLFTAAIGIGLGLSSAVARTVPARIGLGMGGYAVAVLLHGVWNASAAFNAYFELYFAVQVPIFIAFVVLVVVLRHRESTAIRRFLSQYADAGWFTHPEVAMLSTASGRRAARVWAKAQGPASAASMRRFQDAASDVALLRSRMQRGVAGPAASAHERALLEAVTTHRRAFATGVAVGGPA